MAGFAFAETRTATDVGVYAREPALEEFEGGVLGFGCFPNTGDEGLPAFVEGKGLECVLDAYE